jgi:predicted glutamine amidotransferase
MCVIIHKPEGVYLTDSVFEHSYRWNRNGWGILWVNEFGKLKCQKNITDLEDFYKAYEELADKNLVIHFRAGSNVTRDNCHPFMVSKNLGFVHNGNITGFWDKEKSDTNMFNQTFLKPLIKKFPDFYKDKQGKYLLAKKVGISNKLVFMDSDNKVTIINEKEGQREYGCWFSNSQYKPYAPTTYKPYVSPYQSYTPATQPRDYPVTTVKKEEQSELPILYSSRGTLYEDIDEVEEVESSSKFKDGMKQCEHCMLYYNKFLVKEISNDNGRDKINLCRNCIDRNWALYIQDYNVGLYY